ncbi:MAG TPA: LysR family transcriptional regulator [Steroidobacteraceae bacterium]|nr:LysR family transcriptional regulator [Steroidobacteraceae bacterium]
MDRLESMSVFVAVVAAGSFSAASRQLRMPLPTVSRKVAEIESHLKAKLLVRSTRRLVLTEAGQVYVEDCKRILDAVTEAERGASGEYNAPQGELTITAPIVFGRQHVTPVVTEFLRAYAHVDVRLLLADRTLNLVEDRVDLAVRIGTLPDSRLVASKIGQIRRVVCASPAYLKERGTPRVPHDLLKHDCVTFAGLTDAGSWSFRDQQTERVHSRLATSTAEAAIDATLAGLGLTCTLSYQIANAVQQGRLAVVLRKFEPAPLPVSLLYVRESRITAKLRAFIDYAAPRLRARLTAASI